MSITLTNNNFEAQALQSEIPVLIDFYADWCMPCKMLSPIINEISRENDDVKVCKINIDEEPELAKQFQVTSIPTLIVLKDGKETDRAVGIRPKNEILSMLKK